MRITKRDLRGRPRRIGQLNGDPVWELETTGGLWVVAGPKGKPIGLGSHRAIARHIAKETEPDLQFSDLQKADHVPLRHFRDLLPRYQDMTNRIRAAYQE